MKTTRILPLLVLTAVAAAAALPPLAEDNTGPHPARRHQPRPHRLPPHRGTARFGDPLPGLSKAQTDAFTMGLDEFTNTEDAEGGLGPIFNNVSCVACHGVPAIGGTSDKTVTRFGHMVDGKFDPLDALGGSLLQSEAIDPEALEVVPKEAEVEVQRQSTPLFGLGLIEAIPDETLKDLAARTQRDGITGRVAEITDVVSGEKRVGRFGWKAQQVTLLAMAADAYRNEMGITNRFFPTENAPNGDAAKLAKWDKIADPEDQVDPTTGRGDIDVVADFVQLLGPPPQAPAGPTQTSPNVGIPGFDFPAPQPQQ